MIILYYFLFLASFLAFCFDIGWMIAPVDQFSGVCPLKSWLDGFLLDDNVFN